MTIDVTRDTFNPKKAFSRVIMQQGRVQLDADWNEQTAILLHMIRTMMHDMVGPYAGPLENCGFKIHTKHEAGLTVDEENLLKTSETGDFVISAGRYYVHGILCENESPCLFSAQPDAQGQPRLNADSGPTATFYMTYLDVWEKDITAAHDESIREVALNGLDTCARTKICWQVKAQLVEFPKSTGIDLGVDDIWEKRVEPNWKELMQLWQPSNRGNMKAKALETADLFDIEPCSISPNARYRGADNRLYRVEIHRGGRASEGVPLSSRPTFKFSRENASVLFPIVQITENTVQLGDLGRDNQSTIKEGDWVEVVDDSTPALERPEPLLQVVHVDRASRQVTLSGVPGSSAGRDIAKHPLLRRWDHKAAKSSLDKFQLDEGAIVLTEGSGDKSWLTLEDGIQIQFEPGSTPHLYRAGDYWLIPARSTTNDVEWPGPVGNPRAMPPNGVKHYYAPLAILCMKNGGLSVEQSLIKFH